MGVYMYLLHTMYILLQGCAKGKHNPVKPVEPVKPKTKPLAVGEVSVVCFYSLISAVKSIL